MTSWREVEAAVPEFAERVRRRFDVGVNKAIATLRKDGSPRISATELEFEDGELTLGMMDGSLKLLDVRRDPRVAIHSPTIDAPTDDPDWPGDAKCSGRLIEVAKVDERFPGAGFFRLDVEEVVLTVRGRGRAAAGDRVVAPGSRLRAPHARLTGTSSRPSPSAGRDGAPQPAEASTAC